jgi:hypothetical protein
MKTPETLNEYPSAAVKGGAIIEQFNLPTRQNTVLAEVLARLLSGERLRGLDAVYGCSTTRLSAVIHHLEKHWGWEIPRIDVAVGCRDGRVSWVAEYFLLKEVTAKANATDANRWCAEVKAARRLRRIKAVEAEQSAKRLNFAKQIAHHPAQGSLFNG